MSCFSSNIRSYVGITITVTSRPKAKIKIVPQAGHAMSEPGVSSELVRITNELTNTNSTTHLCLIKVSTLYDTIMKIFTLDMNNNPYEAT